MNAIQSTSRHPVSHVAFSPDGTTFAVVQPNYGVTLHDRGTGRAVVTIPVPRVADFSAVAFCGGGAKLAVGSRRGLHVLDAATGKVIAYQGGWMFTGAVLTGRDTEFLAANDYGLRGVRVPASPDEPPGLLSYSLPLKCRAAVIALSPCGRWCVGVRGRTRPVLLNLDSRLIGGEVDHPYRNTGSGRPAVAFAPNGERFAVCDGNDVSVYATADADTDPGDDPADEPTPLVRRTGGTAVAPKPRLLLQPIFHLAPPEGVPPGERWRPAVAFTPDGRGLLVRRPRNRVQLWDVATACIAGEWGWRLESVSCLAVAPDGLTAAVGARFGRVVMWDLE